MATTLLGMTQFDQCVLTMAVIHLCNQESEVGQAMRKLHYEWTASSDDPAHSPWLTPHQFTLCIPHRDQQYEGMTLEEGMTLGYNMDVKPIVDASQLPYRIPEGGHFVVVLKQKGIDADFAIAGTGIFVRSLALLSLDMIVDPDKPEYQSIVVKHPIIRDYPTDWEQKLRLWINQELRYEGLPNLANYVDQAINQDYRPPSWQEIYLVARGFAGV